MKIKEITTDKMPYRLEPIQIIKKPSPVFTPKKSDQIKRKRRA
jgi:hypothetical protein